MSRARLVGTSVLAVVVCGVLALGAACGDTGTAPNVIFLDRPNDVTFGCVGTISTDGGPLASVALSPASCYQQIQPSATTSVTPTPDAGPPPVLGVLSATAVAFVAEGARGDVAVANLVSGLATFVDSDGYVPGLNGLAVGRLPIPIATSPDGCWVMTANSGSCDIGMVNVLRAARGLPGSVTRLTIHSTAGIISARPAGLIAPPPLPSTTPPSECNIVGGTVWVAFSDCHLIARVDINDGSILDGVRFKPGAAPEIVGPDVTCPAQCSAAEMTERRIGLPPPADDAGPILDGGATADNDAGPVEDAGEVAADDAGVLQGNVNPVALAMEPDGTRLYLGGLDSPDVVLIDLDEDGSPTDVNSLELEGAGGISKMAATGEIQMGQQGISGPYRFVYAIASDQSIHVADVTPDHALVECDTQLDRRYLHFITDVSLLPCFPVGGPMNAPRRSEAKGPGIRLPANALPLDVAFISGDTTLADEGSTQPVPGAFNGTFAAVTSFGPDTDTTLHARGWIYFVNVNDNNYEDFQTSFDPLGPDIGLALPHTVRDNVADRRHTSAGDCIENTFSSAAFGPVRIDDSNGSDTIVPTGFVYTDTGVAGDAFAPNVHRILCTANTVLSELSAAAPANTRGPLFADLEEIPDVDNYSFTWEGPLQGTANLREGGSVTVVDTQTLSLQQDGGLFCAVGVETGDVVRLLGCNVDTDCDYNEQCFNHPDAPVGVPGLCFPMTQVSDLAVRCHDALVSERKYSVVQASENELLLTPRLTIFEGTPVNGCIDSPNCMTIQATLVSQAEQSGNLEPGSLPRYNLTCQNDPTRGGPNRCVESCTTSTDCEAGSICQDGLCYLGTVPPSDCISALQAFELDAGDAFTVLTSTAGYRGRQTEDLATGECVEDTTLSPLVVGRFHRIEASCGDVSVSSTSPNPCLISGLQEPLEGSATLSTRDTYAIHFRTPGLTFDIADVAIPVPGLPDQLYTPIGPGYQVSFDIAGGFLPYALEIGAQLPSRIVTGPDGSLWIVDSGEAAGGPEGQLINAGTDGVRVTLF